MDQRNNVNILTLHTIRWIYHTHRESIFLSAKSPDHIRQMISFWANKKELPSESFVKGQKMIDFMALFDWICEKRGYR